MSSAKLEILRRTLKGEIVTPSDLDYPKAIARWALNAQRNAKVVAFVKDERDIVHSIRFAKQENLPIAVKGGGHSISGASSTDGGLVIDLSRHFTSVTVDPHRKVAMVGGGAIWETVDKAAIEHGLASVAGKVNHASFSSLCSSSRVLIYSLCL
jgi:FAD/FMN-containing dehydrogenase